MATLNQATEPRGPLAPPRAVLPTPLQLLFFRTVLCEDAKFPALWNELSQTVQGTELDPALVQHLPTLHRRLTPHQAGALAEAVKLAYRRTWAANHLLFAALRSSLQTLRDAGVPALLLKGSAVLPAFYRDMGLRSMGDCDVLVPAARFGTAVHALTSVGWSPVHPEEGFDPRFAHALALVDRHGNNLDLHGHVLHFTTSKNADELFWSAAVPLNEQQLDTTRLCSADCVLHLSVHGMRWSPVPQLRWIPDIVHVLHSGPMDWKRLVSMAAQLHVSLAVTTVLEYLAGHGFADVPGEVLAHLQAISADPQERELFELSTRDTFSGFRDTARFHWHIMTQNEAGGTLLQKLRLLPAYLSHRRKARSFSGWHDLLGIGLWRHLLSKFGRYERSATGERLR